MPPTRVGMHHSWPFAAATVPMNSARTPAETIMPGTYRERAPPHETCDMSSIGEGASGHCPPGLGMNRLSG